jgi:hypothetical protein
MIAAPSWWMTTSPLRAGLGPYGLGRDVIPFTLVTRILSHDTLTRLDTTGGIEAFPLLLHGVVTQTQQAVVVGIGDIKSPFIPAHCYSVCSRSARGIGIKS